MDSKFIDMIEEIINDESLDLDSIQSEILSILDKARVYQHEATDPNHLVFEIYNTKFTFLNLKNTYLERLEVTRDLNSNSDTIDLAIRVPIGSYTIKYTGDEHEN